MNDGRFQHFENTGERASRKRRPATPAPAPAPKSDYDDPQLVLQTLGTQILAAAARGDIDLNQIAKQELASRGLDYQGKWVGFERAKFLMSMSRVTLADGSTTLVSIPGCDEEEGR